MQKQVIQQTTATQQVQQTVTLHQVQLSHLLELPVEAMDDEIQKAQDENPALERDDDADGYSDATLSTEDLLRDVPDAGYVRRSNEPDDNNLEERLASTETDADVLAQQIALLNLTPIEQQMMDYLAGSLNTYGYLEKDDQTLADELAIGLYLDVNADDVHRLVALLQTLEPTGIGAHDLRECLVLQIDARLQTVPDAPVANSLRTALRILREAWDDYSSRRLERVKNLLHLSSEELAAAETHIRHCNPRPGAALTMATRTEAPAVTPDFFLSVDENGHIDIALSHHQDPRLKVRREFLDIVERHAILTQPSRSEQEAYVYARDKVDRATAYIANLQRRRTMLLDTMKVIAQRQHDFFTHEDDESLLQPLRLQDVAERLHVDISTVSRAANSKYVQTAYGMYPLRHFFNAQTMEKDGQLVSSTQLKVALRDILENEDASHPFSDEQLVSLMQEKGYKIARRTVAKYRSQMGFLPAIQRKK